MTLPKGKTVLLHTILLLKPVHPSSGIHQSLPTAGVEGMTLGTYLNP